jgi:hypothetical protein
LAGSLACGIRAARAFRQIDEGAGKKTKRDSSLRATPFGMTRSLGDADAPTPAELISTITASALASVKIGMSREDVLRVLGKPSSRFSIAGSGGATEYLSFQVEDGRKVTIRLLSGKVAQLP